jgi:primosomal protein N' (replication factor Y)
MCYIKIMIAEIIPESRTFSDVESFTYLVPEHLEDLIQAGSIVKVPFGKRTIRGVVRSKVESQESRVGENKLEQKNPSSPHPDINDIKSESSTLPSPPSDRGEKSYEIKEIKSIDTNFKLPQKYIEIAEWIAKYYLCTLGEAISLFLPPNMKRPRATGGREKGEGGNNSEIQLNSEQQAVFEEIKRNLPPHPTSPRAGEENLRPFLLHGVTGSGKTEIYIKIAKEIIDKGKQVVVLVPEIMLTPQTVERFEKVFKG